MKLNEKLLQEENQMQTKDKENIIIKRRRSAVDKASKHLLNMYLNKIKLLLYQ